MEAGEGNRKEKQSDENIQWFIKQIQLFIKELIASNNENNDVIF
jgi:hypothetical protein